MNKKSNFTFSILVVALLRGRGGHFTSHPLLQAGLPYCDFHFLPSFRKKRGDDFGIAKRIGVLKTGVKKTEFFFGKKKQKPLNTCSHDLFWWRYLPFGFKYAKN